MKRIQINRQHPDPPNTRRCARPGKWGNDFKVGNTFPRKYADILGDGIKDATEYLQYIANDRVVESTEEAIRLYKTYQLPTYTDDDLRELLQYENLGCWCRVGNECHVDALIEELYKRKLL